MSALLRTVAQRVARHGATARASGSLLQSSSSPRARLTTSATSQPLFTSTTVVSPPLHVSPQGLVSSRFSLLSLCPQLRSLSMTSHSRHSIFSKPTDATEAAKDADKSEKDSSGEAPTSTAEEETVPKEKFLEIEQQLNDKITESNDWKDKFARSLADMENLRTRTEKRVEETSHFAIRKFAKDVLDVADVLQLAIDNTPEEKLNQETNPDLVNLFEGLKTTQRMLHGVFERHHVEQVYPLHQKFDPDFHEAVFEVPHEFAGGLDHGHVHEVTKTGYTLRGRTLRAAAVGVVKKPQK